MSAAVTGPAPAPAPARLDVAALIRAASAEDHRATESRGFITQLMSGERDLAEYARYLAQFAHVYEALESRPDDLDDPESVFDPRLRRLTRIDSDLVALGAADWRTRWATLPATADYARHLRALLASSDPLDNTARYLAHHYARYLGDLSGGQAIAVLLARHYDASPTQLSFYDFSELGSVVHAKREYKERMNALEFDPASVDALTAEVLAAFRFNGAIFDQLDA
ncbi:MAG: biliverdin-producing heme oxygenase [Actinomycetota bacterium]|nr:biliverdin-producing heme oxygenase [Actinomycetota bacterium]